MTFRCPPAIGSIRVSLSPHKIRREAKRDTFLRFRAQSEHPTESHASLFSAVLDGVAIGQIAASAATTQLKTLCADPSPKTLSLTALQGTYQIAFTDSPFLSRTSFPLRALGADLPNIVMATGPLYCTFVGDHCHEWSQTTLSITEGQPPLCSYLSLVSRVREVCADHFVLDHLEMRLWCDEFESTRQSLWEQNLGNGEPVRVTPMPRPGMVTRMDWFDGELLVGGFEQFTTVLRRVSKPCLGYLEPGKNTE